MGFALVGGTWQRPRKYLMIYSSGPLARNTTPASLWRIGSLKRAVSFGHDEGSAWPTLPSLTLGKVEGTERAKIRYKTDANFLESVKASSNKEGNPSRAFGPTIADFSSQVPDAEKQPGEAQTMEESESYWAFNPTNEGNRMRQQLKEEEEEKEKQKVATEQKRRTKGQNKALAAFIRTTDRKNQWERSVRSDSNCPFCGRYFLQDSRIIPI